MRSLGLNTKEHCSHYRPAIIYDEEAPLYLHPKKRIGKQKNSAAYSMVIKSPSERGYYCDNCGIGLSERHKKQIDKIVDYLNQGGENDKILSSMFEGIPTADIMFRGPIDFEEFEFSQGVTLSKDSVPPKNVYKKRAK